jgi:pseudaminic acid cytidylyltransferase
MRKLAIIPARAGSKRIPNKNIIDFFGKPIIAYSIEAALSTKLFDEVMVSTDSEEIAEIAREYGAKVPFLRSKKNASDHSTTVDAILEVLEMYISMGRSFEVGCCIYPAAPLITSNLIQSCFDLFQEGNWDTVFPAIEYSHPIDRAFVVNKKGSIEMFNTQNKFKRTQDLKKTFHDSGQFYWFNSSKLASNKTLFTNKTSVLKVSEIETQDIDNLDDLIFAKIKYKYKLNGN